MTTPLLTDSEGRKIGKTEGNVIALTDTPESVYGKIMALGDDVIAKGLEFLTDVPMDRILEIEKEIKNGENPMQYKKLLAFEITKQLHSEEKAQKAQDNFKRVIQEHQTQDEIAEVTLDDDHFLDEDFLVDYNLASSKSDAKRLFQQGGIDVDGEKLLDSGTKRQLKNGMIIRIGKRKIIKIKSK